MTLCTLPFLTAMIMMAKTVPDAAELETLDNAPDTSLVHAKN